MSKFLKYKDQRDRINFDVIVSYYLHYRGNENSLNFILSGSEEAIIWDFKSKEEAEECLKWLDEQLLAKDENEIIAA